MLVLTSIYMYMNIQPPQKYTDVVVEQKRALSPLSLADQAVQYSEIQPSHHPPAPTRPPKPSARSPPPAPYSLPLQGGDKHPLGILYTCTCMCLHVMRVLTARWSISLVSTVHQSSLYVCTCACAKSTYMYMFLYLYTYKPYAHLCT